MRVQVSSHAPVDNSRGYSYPLYFFSYRSEKNKKYQLMIKELLLKLKDENISELVKIKLEILILRIEIELEEISKNFFKEEFTEFFKKSLTIIENEKNTIVKKYFKSKIKK